MNINYRVCLHDGGKVAADEELRIVSHNDRRVELEEHCGGHANRQMNEYSLRNDKSTNKTASENNHKQTNNNNTTTKEKREKQRRRKTDLRRSSDM